VIVESHTGLKLREMLESSGTGDAGPAPPAAAGAKALDRPSLAVLPFTNMSGDLEQEYLADGITEDLISALACLRWLFVIARNSSFTYKDKAVDVRQVAQELGGGHLTIMRPKHQARQCSDRRHEPECGFTKQDERGHRSTQRKAPERQDAEAHCEPLDRACQLGLQNSSQPRRARPGVARLTQPLQRARRRWRTCR